ncbi:sarcosine oxidase subunit beta [Thalassobaculum fulvum]|uniref:Sarcosine oxidase subunit beta n=1 Tax=Thalassobaculum fulvum TaxID=1633335 RepID=A0A919CPQ1_9PROT|nr:FAD-dependent oxidoreductase [Thalassobaculum fulvum]GHD50054.1 sarcosine oxidase subunit beta [Thalassobaculum fulvum]
MAGGAAKTARPDMIVIGGGLIGLSTAVAAARAGMAVTLLEARTCGRHASSASAGGVRSLNRHPSEIAMARAALELWRRAPELFGDHCGYAESSQVRVAEDEAALDGLKARLALSTGLGWNHEKLIERDELYRRVPALAGHCLGALVVEDDGFADPLRAVHAFRRTARSLGVTILENTPVATIERDGAAVAIGTADGTAYRAATAVNCAGAWGAGLAAAVGEPVDVRPVALQMTVTEPVPAFVKPVIGTQGRKLSLKQSEIGTVVIGGGFEGRADLATGDSDLDFEGVTLNLANAVRLFPVLATARVVRTWCGIEGIARDDLPVLGPSATMPGLIHAFGFSGHGFALCPLIGEVVRDLAGGRNHAFDLGPFAPDRFAST